MPPLITFRQALCGGLSDPEGAVETQAAKGWKARPDCSAWRVEAPVDWAADPFEDRNWRFQLNAWRPCDVLLTASDVLKRPELLDRAADLMLDWADFEGANQNEALLWNDMGTGLRAAKLAFVLSRPAPAGRETDWDRLAALGRRHLARLRDRTFISLTNHGLFQVHGCMALCLVMPDAPEADGGRDYVEQVFGELLAAQFGTEAVHLEHSPGYHHFALKTVRRFLASRWYDDMPGVRALAAKAEAAMPWFVFPDGRMSATGDSERREIAIKPPATTEPVVARLFREAGYAVVRSDWRVPEAQAGMLLVAGGHHRRAHKHADDLSFELFEQGRMLFADTGKYSYSRLDWREFTDSARAHNTIDLLEERQDNGFRHEAPTGGVLHGLDRRAWGWEINGGFARPKFGVRHDRTFLYRPGEWLVLVDRVEASRPRCVTAWLHLAPELTAVEEDRGWRFDGGGIRYWTDAGALSLERRRGAIEPVIQGWVATGYHRKAERDSLGASLAGQRMSLVTIIDLGAGDAPVVEPYAGGTSLSWRGELIHRLPVPIIEQSDAC